MSLRLKRFIYKKLTKPILSTGGRNQMGRITVRHRVQNVR